MTNWRIGLSTGCFYNQSIIECLPLIRESGFGTIEVCSSPTHLDFHDEVAVKRAANQISELGIGCVFLARAFCAKHRHFIDRRRPARSIGR